MTPERQALLRYRLARACEALEESRLLLNAGHANACVNRLYYDCFYAVSALLLIEGHASAKHRGVRALFDQHWVKPGRVPPALGRLDRRLFMRRQRGDYDDLVQFEETEVRAWLADAERFVDEISEVVHKHVPCGPAGSGT